ncbi:uncharacterized protein B0H64DRAFT_406667 [Chaetomium fimeti]|uniref:HTH CENPB-type domain-containing protein n=1 Tax=Chaetomium fimeti TaxID=1854472 RepID=A0AAE0LPB7_9PEZI|nr:hypothetical protein B0H64DRAFT_406667 [Chaetomium fimeti]
MMASREDLLQQALDKYNQGGHTLQQIAKEFRVPVHTLKKRRKDHPRRPVVLNRFDVLPQPLEDGIYHWISIQADLGVPPTQLELHAFVGRVLKAQPGSRVASLQWIDQFKIRRSIVLSGDTLMLHKDHRVDRVEGDDTKEPKEPQHVEEEKSQRVEQGECESSDSDDSCFIVRWNKKR